MHFGGCRRHRLRARSGTGDAETKQCAARSARISTRQNTRAKAHLCESKSERRAQRAGQIARRESRCCQYESMNMEAEYDIPKLTIPQPVTTRTRRHIAARRGGRAWWYECLRRAPSVSSTEEAAQTLSCSVIQSYCPAPSCARPTEFIPRCQLSEGGNASEMNSARPARSLLRVRSPLGNGVLHGDRTRKIREK